MMSRIRVFSLFTLSCLAFSLSTGAATISGFTPDRGGPGTEVTVFGTSLQTATFVYFGSTEASGTILSRSATSVRALVPPNALTGQISIFTSGAGAASSLQIFVTTPRIEEFTPLSGAPGALVTVSGANFGTGQFGSRGNITSVLFNGQPALFELSGINQLLTQVPPNATTGPLTLANEAGATSTLLPFHVAPLISTIAPTNGVPGDAIEIRGSNLGAALRVEFGLERADFSVVSPSNLVARVPTNAVNARIQITTPAGAVSSTNLFTVQPRILQFLPVSGSPGTNVVIEGGGFHGLTAVEFNGTSSTFQLVSSTRVHATVPNNATTGPIRLVTTNGTYTTSNLFHIPPRLTSFTPGAGKSGDLITLDGQNLAGTTRVLFNGAAAAFTVVSPTRLSATVPPEATPGRITVETPAGAVLSSGTFNVVPLFTGFSPANATAGTPITISGAGLTNLTWIRLGGIDMSFTLLGPTSVRAIVPLNAFSGGIRARNANGVEFDAPGVFIVDGARPTLTSFSPTEGPVGTPVTIQGQGLLSATRVQFNGTDAVLGTKTATTLQTTVPPGATTGLIAVTTLDGIAASTTPFTVPEGSASLTVSRSTSGDEIVIRWSTSATGYILQATPTLGTQATWTPVPATPEIDGASFRVTLPLPAGGATYYRLRK